MKCLILAAGYATRLYPLTENFPKPLLEVGNKTILDWLVDDIDTLGEIDEYIVVSNHKYAEHFIKWAKSKKQKVTVVDDLTETNETRLGAVKDIQFVIEKLSIDDDLLVIAGDNVLDFSLTEFIKYFLNKNASCIMRYFESDSQRLLKSGVVTLEGESDKVVKMAEKPSVPETNWCCPPFYCYKKSDIKLVKKGIEQGCGTDAPGSFVSWLCTQVDVYAMKMPGKRYDIGNLESYDKVRKEYVGTKN